MCEESVKMFSFSCDVQPCDVSEKGKGEEDSKDCFALMRKLQSKTFLSLRIRWAVCVLCHIIASILGRGFTKLIQQKAPKIEKLLRESSQEAQCFNLPSVQADQNPQTTQSRRKFLLSFSSFIKEKGNFCENEKCAKNVFSSHSHVSIKQSEMWEFEFEKIVELTCLKLFIPPVIYKDNVWCLFDWNDKSCVTHPQRVSRYSAESVARILELSKRCRLMGVRAMTAAHWTWLRLWTLPDDARWTWWWATGYKNWRNGRGMMVDEEMWSQMTVHDAVFRGWTVKINDWGRWGWGASTRSTSCGG